LQAQVGGDNTTNRPENCSGNRTENHQFWFVNSGCSRHMTGTKSNFLSLVASNGGSVAFGNGKFGTIVGIGKISESLSHSIDGVYLVDGLKHNLLSVSQLCDKDNLVVFSSNRCMVVNMNTRNTVLRGKQHKNVYKVSIPSLFQNHLTCLSVLDVMGWHPRLGYASFLISWCLSEYYVLRKVCMCYLMNLTL